MGQKVNPNGIRLGIVKPWNSTWFANTQDFADNLDGDFKVRKFLTKELANASVSRITIERPAKSIRVTIHTARPGIVIGKKGEDVEIIKLEGSVELGPVTGISDAIVDIVETGSTLKANGLEVIEKISDISTRLIVNKVSFKFKKDEIMNLVNKLEAVTEGK